MNLTPNPTDDDLDRLLAACGLKTLRPCGTAAAYHRHLDHGEDPCQPCRDANREAGRRLARSEHTRLRPIKHGSPAGARAHQWPGEPACMACVLAYRAYQAERRAARKSATSPAA